MPASRKKALRPQIPIVPAREELRALVAAIEGELASWPQIRLSPMFGMTGVYRGKTIFGLLPKTRGLRSGDCLWVKLPNPTSTVKKKLAATPRILPPSSPSRAQWYTLSEVRAEDYRFLIEWLAIAHAAAK